VGTYHGIEVMKLYISKFIWNSFKKSTITSMGVLCYLLLSKHEETSMNVNVLHIQCMW